MSFPATKFHLIFVLFHFQGFHKSNEFIITQHPLEQTMEDFWRMVWDQNSSVIVMLSDIDEDVGLTLYSIGYF